uniref:PDZ domain-containing protein n=1 Tax=Panagrolaimus sp. JU765 TaxID=591449 RepID=A0AC34QX92_9BILA
MFFAKLERLFTRSVDNDRTEEEHVTKKSPNYRAIPDNVLQKLTVLIINKDAAKKLGIRVGRTLHVSSILQNSPANGQLKPGDLILSINGTKMNARNQFDEVIAKINDGKFKFEVKRPRPPKELETDSEINKNLPNSYDRLPGYKYFVGNICVYPGANLGIHIMSLESKVYVTNAPQDSLAGEVFNMGDAILAIDGVPSRQRCAVPERMVQSPGGTAAFWSGQKTGKSGFESGEKLGNGPETGRRRSNNLPGNHQPDQRGNQKRNQNGGQRNFAGEETGENVKSSADFGDVGRGARGLRPVQPRADAVRRQNRKVRKV